MTLPAYDHSNLDIDAVNQRLKHYDITYKLLVRITDAIQRNGLSEQYWLSTKNDSNTAVIHCEDCFYEGPIGYVADMLDITQNAQAFEQALKKNMFCGEYEWAEFKKKEDTDGQ